MIAAVPIDACAYSAITATAVAALNSRTDRLCVAAAAKQLQERPRWQLVSTRRLQSFIFRPVCWLVDAQDLGALGVEVSEHNPTASVTLAGYTGAAGARGVVTARVGHGGSCS